MPDNSFIETINHLFGGAITTLIGAFTLAQIVTHNEIGVRLCGWRP